MADNRIYAAAVIDAVTTRYGASGPLVLSGFSQGVAMAFRAASTPGRRVAGAIVLGGDVPPELDREALGRIPNVLLGRGARDERYTAAKQAVDVARLTESGAKVDAPVLDAGHEWTVDFSREAGEFLSRLPI